LKLTIKPDEFIPSQLLLINHDKLAQYWMPFGHISFYHRVDVEALVARTFYPGMLPPSQRAARDS
jgi:hypothetical protein